MDLKEPRPKKFCKTPLSWPLPLIKTPDDGIYKFTGKFDCVSVIIEKQKDKEQLYRMGFFGKASLSKSFPSNSNPENTDIIRKRQFQCRKSWSEVKNIKKNALSKVLVIPDSDSEDENYFSNIQAEFQIDYGIFKETVNLSLAEAYFLSQDIKCLDVYYEDKLTEGETLWANFSSTDRFFAAKYITYYHFRKKNWITKAGIKFGGDFLLYKDGPPFYHASYIVIIDVIDENHQRREDLQIRSMKFTNLIGLNRLCETVGKELLICQLVWPRDIIVSSSTDVTNVSVNEVLMRRWIGNKENNLYNKLELKTEKEIKSKN